MSERLQTVFPGLSSTSHRITSPANPTYNCIAWAAGDVSAWWWPFEDFRKTHWPDQAPRECTLEAFRMAFASLDFYQATDASWEPGYDKVAIFTDHDGIPTHAARQLPEGRWTSKLGSSEDIEHELAALEGDVYGTVTLILKRLAKSSSNGQRGL